MLPSKLSELKEALRPYRKLWFLWIQSPSCFLTPEEISAVNVYYKTGSYMISAQQLKISHIIHYVTIKNAISKLHLFLPLFENWIKLREELDGLLKIKYEAAWGLE
ncbi:MAG: hypothetical protein ACXVPQ_08650 [Bacteroidia bacterium]